MYRWWKLCTLYLHECHMSVPVGDPGLCCYTCVTSFERELTPLCVDSLCTWIFFFFQNGSNHLLSCCLSLSVCLSVSVSLSLYLSVSVSLSTFVLLRCASPAVIDVFFVSSKCKLALAAIICYITFKESRKEDYRQHGEASVCHQARSVVLREFHGSWRFC